MRCRKERRKEDKEKRNAARNKRTSNANGKRLKFSD
jgi:hypothetical protein